MNGVLGHLCAHIVWTGAGEPPEDGVMNEMTLPSRICKSSPGGPRPSLPLCHGGSLNIESLRVSGEETLCFFETRRPEWGSKPQSPTFQAGSFNNCIRVPVLNVWHHNNNVCHHMILRHCILVMKMRYNAIMLCYSQFTCTMAGSRPKCFFTAHS